MYSYIKTTHFNLIPSYTFIMADFFFATLSFWFFYVLFFFFIPRIGEIIFFNLHLLHGPAGSKINSFLYGACIAVVLLCNLWLPHVILMNFPISYCFTICLFGILKLPALFFFWLVFWFARAAMAKYYRVGSLNNRHSFSHHYGG